MAATLRASQDTFSDVAYDVCCSICKDDGIYTEGLFYCLKCSKYLCDSCVKTHNKFLKDHSVTTKSKCDNWPHTKTADDTLDLCEIHTSEKLTMFCDDHEKLLCQFCLLHNHRQCSHVVPLADKIKSATQRMDIAQMSTSNELVQKRLEDMVKIGEENINSLQTSYERALKEILNVLE
ncbi:transcription intermediary factor 1-beta-like [Dreissena polymorpha]|uniref:transcription intermediary factor 1-beta-like n=1 Tax=Dreissena polymorpha TaxID=45954 RepID=UPI0022644B82|nr:transcription intermediary factor 1-beta-like [Dreissena polymorpha]